MADVADGLKPANENPWYVLMTLYEMRGNVYPPDDAQEKNRKFWNAWVGKNFTLKPEALAACSPVQRKELTEWKDAFQELKTENREFSFIFERAIETLSGQRPKSINLNSSILNGYSNFEGYVFPKDLNLNSTEIKGHINFSGALFGGKFKGFGTKYSGDANFQKTQFLGSCDLSHGQFDGKFVFSDVTIQGAANFGHSTFEGNADFSKSTLFDVTFNHSTFKSDASFRNAAFQQTVIFETTNFFGETNFVGSSFKGFANFKTATFQSHAYFSQTNFSRGSFFQGTTFKGFTYFTNASFTGEVEHDLYETAFTDCQFEKTTSFEGATFRGMYPKLRGTTLHETTSFTAEKTNWPSTIDSKPQAALAKETCSVIRHNLAKQGFPEKEHFFFRREMEATGKSQDLWKNLPYRFFGIVSDYGHSILRPCLFLLGLWIIPAFIYLWAMTWSSVMSGSFAVSLRAFGFSFANIFKFLGFQKTYFVKEFETLNPWLDFLSAGQTVFGFVFLFFLGLGLRQRFRLR